MTPGTTYYDDQPAHEIPELQSRLALRMVMPIVGAALLAILLFVVLVLRWGTS